AAQTTNSLARPTAVAEANMPQVGVGSSVSGVVSDPQGAVVSGATVTLTGRDGSMYTFTTGDDGMYKFLLLTPGSYRLMVDAVSFPSSAIDEIQLADGGDDTINIELKLPELIAETTITTTTEVVQVTSGVVGFIEPENPLVKAVFQDDLEAAKELAFAALDLNAPDKNTHVTALEQAVENGNVEIVRILILAGA